MFDFWTLMRRRPCTIRPRSRSGRGSSVPIIESRTIHLGMFSIQDIPQLRRSPPRTVSAVVRVDTAVLVHMRYGYWG